MNVIICKKANATKIDIKIICYLFCESYESHIIYYKEYIYIFISLYPYYQSIIIRRKLIQLYKLENIDLAYTNEVQIQANTN